MNADLPNKEARDTVEHILENNFDFNNKNQITQNSISHKIPIKGK